ncbi:glycosyltransferase family 4 protein [Ensifer adhaerens]|uniref:glycosyltransferase family 4 protein n=1 Tax=Ensifer adhaerens TaxID=106592 RepID=UPI001F45B2B8|nr:glycosyltransferase family 1 protein [Ensifer adhaerens]
MGGRHINRLDNASLYYDAGRGLNERDRSRLVFREDATGNHAAYIKIDEDVRNLRFDPTEGGRLTFAAQAILLERLEKRNWDAAVAQPIVKRELKLGADGKLRLLVNLFRLLPAHKGAGGAGRLALAFLRYLPEFANVRVIIADHNQTLVSEFPDVDFVLAGAESYSELEDHFRWSDCYFDFLNALRPTFIPSHVVVLSCLLDLQHMRLPMLFSSSELSARLREYGYAVDRADRLIAISDYERENLEFFYGKKNVSVVPLSGFAAEDFVENNSKVVARRAPNVQTYLLYPAVPWAHKNHETLIQAVAVLKRTGRHVRLVLTNTDSNPGNKRKLQRLCENFDVSDCIELKGYVSEPELIDLMRESSGLVFPSLYEGFGIPLADAMKLGVPVLASKIPAILEICGPAAAYFANHRNALSMADDIWSFWCSRDEKVEAIAAGTGRGELFSSRRMAREVVEAAGLAVASRNTRLNPVGFPRPREPQKNVLSLLLLIEKRDVCAVGDLARTIEQIGSVLGAEVDLTVALDAAVIEHEDFLPALKRVSKLIVFDASWPTSRQAAVEEFARRYNSSEFHMVVDWVDHEMISPAQIIALVHGLRHNPEAKYAAPEADLREVAVGNVFSELDVIARFEKMRANDNVITGVMFRAEGNFRDSHHGTTQFLSAYCSENSFVRVPAIRADYV